MGKLKLLFFVKGILPITWYIYQIQGKLMAHQLTVLDSILTASDACAIFPHTSAQMFTLVATVKEETEAALAAIIAVPSQERTFKNTAQAMDLMKAGLEKASALLYTCQMVYPDKELRELAQRLVLDLSAYSIEKLSFNMPLYEAFKGYAQSNAYHEQLNDEQLFFISEALKDFKRSGYELEPEKQHILKELQKELVEISQEFDINIAKDVRSIAVTRDELPGLSDEQIVPYFDQETGKYVLKTDYPTVDLILQNCALENTRKALWLEFNNRAYPENMELLKKVIVLRDKIAQLLGYPSYTHYNLDDSMAQSPERVRSFLQELESRASIKAEQEIAQLTSDLPAGVVLNDKDQLKPWDVGYVKHYYKKNHLALDERAIAEYFPLEKTINLLLGLYEDFLGLRFEQLPATHLWNPDVKLIKATSDGQLLGYLFLDLYPRDNKYTHACNLSIINGLRDAAGMITTPVVTVVITNFPKPTGDKPALLLRNDVNTFFHEFGHAVHALCGITQMYGFSGTNVKRDFVELPSQMLEQWLWQPYVLKQVSGHYKTGLGLSDDLIDAMLKTKNFDTGILLNRQLVFANQSLESFNEDTSKDAKQLYQRLWERLLPYQEYSPDDNHTASFGHLTGYGAQYYGYLWSKVFALDLFEYIKKHTISPEIGARYRDMVIGKGGSKDPLELLRDFLGREPTSDAFFKDMGI